MSKRIYKSRRKQKYPLIPLHVASRETIQQHTYMISISKEDNRINVIWKIHDVPIGTTVNGRPIYGRSQYNTYTDRVTRDNPPNRSTIRYLTTEAGIKELLKRSKHTMYKYE